MIWDRCKENKMKSSKKYRLSAYGIQELSITLTTRNESIEHTERKSIMNKYLGGNPRI